MKGVKYLNAENILKDPLIDDNLKILKKTSIDKSEALEAMLNIHKSIVFNLNKKHKELMTRHLQEIENVQLKNESLANKLEKMQKQIDELINKQNNMQLI